MLPPRQARQNTSNTLCICVSIDQSKGKNGPSFGPQYFRGSGGIEGLNTKCTLDDIKHLIKEKVLQQLEMDDNKEWDFHDRYNAGGYLYCRPGGKPIVRTPTMIKMVVVMCPEELQKTSRMAAICSLLVVGSSVFMNDVSSTTFYMMLHMSIFYVLSSTQNAEENSRQNTNDSN
jgi:hypothetical protein